MPDVSDLERELNNAAKRLSGSSGKSASGVEKGYGQAYQALVRAGARNQLRLKYRR